MMRFRCLSFGIILAALLLAQEGQAQGLEFTSTDPSEGSMNVEDTKRVTFHLNKPLPAFGSQFAEKFIWSPRTATRLTTFGHDFDEQGKLTIIFFALEHEPATDVSFIAFGIRANDGSKMHRPYVLNYTTAGTAGTNSVAGTVAFGERSIAPASNKRQILESAVRRALFSASGNVFAGSETAQKVAGRMPTTGITPQAAISNSEIRRSVVVLLERYSLDESRWKIRKAAVPDDTGSFNFDNVRDGTYWPVAINFATDDGEAIGSYGFYDADGDLEPDPIDVREGVVPDVELELYSASPFTASANLQLAWDVAAQYAEDQQLMHIMALRGPARWEAYPAGTANAWSYTFFSASESLTTQVAIDPINVFVETEEGRTYEAHAMPESFIDTDVVMEIADTNVGHSFRSMYPGETIRIAIQGGDLPLAYRPPPDKVFWMVQYRSPENAEFHADTVFIDAVSGDVLQGQPVSTESPTSLPYVFGLDQNYPNPFNPSTIIPFVVDRSGQVTLRVYNTLGQEVARPVDRHFNPGKYEVSWAGDDLPSGLYFYQITSDGRTETRRMVMAR